MISHVGVLDVNLRIGDGRPFVHVECPHTLDVASGGVTTIKHNKCAWLDEHKLSLEFDDSRGVEHGCYITKRICIAITVHECFHDTWVALHWHGNLCAALEDADEVVSFFFLSQAISRILVAVAVSLSRSSRALLNL